MHLLVFSMQHNVLSSMPSLTFVLIFCATAIIFLFLTVWPILSPGVVGSHVGEVVVITGASSGIGAELAVQYAKAGASIVVAARRQAELEGVVSLALKAGAPAAIAIRADMGLQADCERVINATLEKFGGLDTLIINHAMFDEGLFVDRKDFEKTLLSQFHVNVMGAVYTIRAALPFLEASARGGHVVEVSSGTTLIAAPFHPGYGTTKTALRGLIKHISAELSLLYSPVRFTTCILGLIGTPEVVVTEGLRALAYPVVSTARDIIVAAQNGVREAFVPHWVSFGATLSFLDPTYAKVVEHYFMSAMYTFRVPEYVEQLKVSDRRKATGNSNESANEDL